MEHFKSSFFIFNLSSAQHLIILVSLIELFSINWSDLETNFDDWFINVFKDELLSFKLDEFDKLWSTFKFKKKKREKRNFNIEKKR